MKQIPQNIISDSIDDDSKPVIVCVSTDKNGPFGYKADSYYNVIFDAYEDDNGVKRVNASDQFNSNYDYFSKNNPGQGFLMLILERYI